MCGSTLATEPQHDPFHLSMHVSVSLSRIESCCWTFGAIGPQCVPRQGGRREEEPSGSPWRGAMVQGCGRGCHVRISSLRRRLAFHRVSNTHDAPDGRARLRKAES
ncbi:unnamed protein product [Lota lota]